MALTYEQLVILAADIAADPILSAYPETADGAFAIAAVYNTEWSPPYYVWQTQVTPAKLMQGAGFDWTRIDNLTVGKARIWDFMTRVASLDSSQPTVRAGFEACFSVEAADQATRQAIYNQCQRHATRVEKLFATGSGTTSTHHGIGPSVMGFEGQISFQDVQEALALS